eukprot:TRINITY_DN115095_c0_g1_i1.p1 TRINITY_DN115095_c0_g1~~TRINITY_DN115095_c0_g1_i1.p1  ORF type:complete len:107 (+),score=1.41 TRINITY_DN115095_c0_g1_i1:94-414(+)
MSWLWDALPWPVQWALIPWVAVPAFAVDIVSFTLQLRIPANVADWLAYVIVSGFYAAFIYSWWVDFDALLVQNSIPLAVNIHFQGSISGPSLVRLLCLLAFLVQSG